MTKKSKNISNPQNSVLNIADVRKSLIDFANFIGDRPLPEYSKSINKWRWWDNNLRDYKTASTEELLSEWEKSINAA